MPQKRFPAGVQGALVLKHPAQDLAHPPVGVFGGRQIVLVQLRALKGHKIAFKNRCGIRPFLMEDAGRIEQHRARSTRVVLMVDADTDHAAHGNDQLVKGMMMTLHVPSGVRLDVADVDNVVSLGFHSNNW